MKRIMIRYMLAVLIAYALSLSILVWIAWSNRHEAHLTGGLTHLIQIVEEWQASPSFSSNQTGFTVSKSRSTAQRSYNDARNLLDDQSELDYFISLKTPKSREVFGVRLSQELVDNANKREDWALLLFSFLSFMIFAAIGAVLSWPFVKRLQRHEVVIQQLADGDLSARTLLGDTSPVGQLGNRLNLMACRLEKMVENHKDILRTVSHELRTPINRSHFLIDLIEKELAPLSGSVQRKLQAIQENLTEQDQLIEELLTYSRLEMVPELELSNVDLNVVLQNVFENQKQLFPNITCRSELPNRKTLIQGNERLLGRLFSNLLGNALRFATSNVDIVLSCKSQAVTLLISNDGESISSDDRERVFEPFVRLNENSGAGLGLAICRKIMQLHQGEIAFVEPTHGGTTCRVRWNAPVRQDGRMNFG